MTDVNKMLWELFQAHGVAAILESEWILFPDRNMKAKAAIVQQNSQPSSFTIQLDIILALASGQVIVESFAGIGQTCEQAIGDGLENFIVNSFHVLLAAFFLAADDDQVTKEEWMISGVNYQATIGNACIRGKLPIQLDQLSDYFTRFQEKITRLGLWPGIHWLRLFYAQNQRASLACEVLRDNEVWDELQQEMSAIDWPAAEEYFRHQHIADTSN
jgi:hypothetical protein